MDMKQNKRNWLTVYSFAFSRTCPVCRHPLYSPASEWTSIPNKLLLDVELFDVADFPDQKEKFRINQVSRVKQCKWKIGNIKKAIPVSWLRRIVVLNWDEATGCHYRCDLCWFSRPLKDSLLSDKLLLSKPFAVSATSLVILTLRIQTLAYTKMTSEEGIVKSASSERETWLPMTTLCVELTISNLRLAFR